MHPQAARDVFSQQDSRGKNTSRLGKKKEKRKKKKKRGRTQQDFKLYRQSDLNVKDWNDRTTLALQIVAT